MTRLALAVLATSLCALGASRASANARAHLSWQRPDNASCPSGEAVAHDVGELLGQPVFGPAPAAVEIAGVLREQGDEVLAELSARVDGELVGVRQLRAPRGDCAALRRPIALVLAMLLDDAGARVEPPRDTPRPQPTRWFGALSGGAELGLLPRASAALDAGVGLVLGSGLSVALRAGYALPVQAETARGAGGRFQALLGTLSVCPALSHPGRRSVLRGCLGVALDALLATPVGLVGAGSATRLAAALPVSLSLTTQLSGSTSLELAAGPSFFVVRPTATMSLRDGSELLVHRPAPVAGFFRASLIIQPR